MFSKAPPCPKTLCFGNDTARKCFHNCRWLSSHLWAVTLREIFVCFIPQETLLWVLVWGPGISHLQYWCQMEIRGHIRPRLLNESQRCAPQVASLGNAVQSPGKSWHSELGPTPLHNLWCCTFFIYQFRSFPFPQIFSLSSISTPLSSPYSFLLWDIYISWLISRLCFQDNPFHFSLHPKAVFGDDVSKCS